jgi:hypothetical protein
VIVLLSSGCVVWMSESRMYVQDENDEVDKTNSIKTRRDHPNIFKPKPSDN